MVDESAGLAHVQPPRAVYLVSLGEDFAGSFQLDEYPLPPWQPEPDSWLSPTPPPDDFVGTMVDEYAPVPWRGEPTAWITVSTSEEYQGASLQVEEPGLPPIWRSEPRALYATSQSEEVFLPPVFEEYVLPPWMAEPRALYAASQSEDTVQQLTPEETPGWLPRVARLKQWLTLVVNEEWAPKPVPPPPPIRKAHV